MKPTASIVIPTFNRAGLLGRAIDSSLAQTHGCEVVVCDHGSTDDTPKVAARYGDRIRYVRRDEDRGPIACWRDGVEQATGEYLHINYDDDWIDPAFMARCLELFRHDVGFVYTRYAVHDAVTNAIWIAPCEVPGVRPMRLYIRHQLRLPLATSPGCAVFRRKDVLNNLLPEVPDAAGVYGKRSGVGEDLLLFLLTSLSYPRYAYVPEALAHFLAHPQSITINAFASKKHEQMIAAYANAKVHYHRQPGSESPRNSLQDLFDRVQWKLLTALP